MLTHQRVKDVADAVRLLSDTAIDFYAELHRVLEMTADVNVSWTPITKVFTAANATDLLTATAHGLLADQKGRLTNSGGALPAGLLPHTDYFLVTITANTFQLATTRGGAPVTFTTDGTGTHTFNPVPAYLTEDEDSNLSGLTYDRVQVANAIGSFTQLRNAFNNSVVTQGDHLGNLNQLARPQG